MPRSYQYLLVEFSPKLGQVRFAWNYRALVVLIRIRVSNLRPKAHRKYRCLGIAGFVRPVPTNRVECGLGAADAGRTGMTGSWFTDALDWVPKSRRGCGRA